MMHMFPLHFSGVYDGMWLVPNFSIPAYFFCLTIAAKYWIEDSLVRRRTYFASTSISPAILLCGGAYFMPGYVLFPGFRSILAAMASVGVILYSILNIRKNVKTADRLQPEKKPCRRRDPKNGDEQLGSFVCSVSAVSCLRTGRSQSWFHTVF